MPRYFFNMQIAGDHVRDSEGVVLADPDEAWQVARTTIRELLIDEDQSRFLLTAVLEVTDTEGEVVLEFPFSEALLDGGSFGNPVARRH